MALTVTDLAEEVRESNRRLNASIDRLDTAVEGLRKETEDLRVEVAMINTTIGWLRSVGRVVAGSAFAMLILIGTGIYRFGHVEAEITRLGNDMSELKKEMKELKDEFRARDDRLARVLDRIEKALPPAPRDRP